MTELVLGMKPASFPPLRSAQEAYDQEYVKGICCCMVTDNREGELILSNRTAW